MTHGSGALSVRVPGAESAPRPALGGTGAISGPEILSRPIPLPGGRFPSCPQNIQQAIHKKLKFSGNFWLQMAVFGSIVGLKAKGSRTPSRADRTAFGPRVRGEGGSHDPSLRGTVSLRAGRSRDRQPPGGRSPGRKAFGRRDPVTRAPPGVTVDRAGPSSDGPVRGCPAFGPVHPKDQAASGPKGPAGWKAFGRSGPWPERLRAQGPTGQGDLRGTRFGDGRPPGRSSKGSAGPRAG